VDCEEEFDGKVVISGMVRMAFKDLEFDFLGLKSALDEALAHSDYLAVLSFKLSGGECSQSCLDSAFRHVFSKRM
jgi:hypothetical protein